MSGRRCYTSSPNPCRGRSPSTGVTARCPPTCPRSPSLRGWLRSSAPPDLPTPSAARSRRPKCVIQDEAFGVRHQLITVPTQLAGNPIGCAARQRGAEASGRKRRHGRTFWPVATGRTVRANPVPPHQVRARAGPPLASAFSSPLICLLRLRSVVMWRRWVGPPTISRSVESAPAKPSLQQHIRPGRMEVPPERRR